MDKDFETRFLDGLTKGTVETVTPETHPFALVRDDMDICDRCGERVGLDSMTLRMTAHLTEDGDSGKLFPLIIKECPKCVEVEGRFHDAKYETAAA